MSSFHRAIAGVACAALVVGCTLIGDFATARCSTSDDCVRLGLAGAVCVADNCVARDAGAIATDGAAEAEVSAPTSCRDSVECTEQNGGLSAACVEGACVNVAVPVLCPLVVGQDKLDTDPRTLLFGAFVYLSPTGPATTPAYATIDLAVRQINGAGGLPTADGPRFVSVVVCTKETPQKVSQAADHLLRELKVPAIFGQLETDEIKSLLPSALQSDTLVLSTLGNDQTLKSVNDRGPGDADLLWFAVDDIKNVAPAYGPVLALAEQRARARSSDPLIQEGSKDIKVVLVATKSAETQALASALTNPTAPILRFNGGKSPAENGSRFVRAPDVDSLYRVPNAQATIGTVAAAIRSEQPHVVIGVNGDELAAVLIPAIEGGWGAGDRPIYIGSPLTRFNGPALYDAMAKSAFDLRSRFVGVDFSGDEARLERFYAAFAADTRFSAVRPREGYNVLYDATFLLVGAAQAALAKGQPLRGSTISAGMHAVIDGPTSVEVFPTAELGSTAFVEGLAKLRQGESIRLMGTSGPLTLSTNGGDRAMGASVYCVEDDGGALKLRFYASEYDHETRQLSAAPPCF